MTTTDKVLLIVGATLCGLAAIFGLAAVFIPSFDASKTLIVGTILGALTTMASIIVGATWARNTIGQQGQENPPTETGLEGGAQRGDGNTKL